MTTDERAMLQKYRADGYGYKKISQLTGLSINTVKSYCKRNDLLLPQIPIAKTGKKNVCKYCGSPLSQLVGKKEKLFCSSDCRNKWWNSHPDLLRHRNARVIRCGGCGRTLTVRTKSNQKYCSHSCYIAVRFGGVNS